MNKMEINGNPSKGRYIVSKARAGKKYKVEVVGFSRKLIDGFKKDMKEIYEEESMKKDIGVSVD